MILEEIVADKKRRLPEHMARISESQMRRMAEETKTREANCFYNHLKKPGLSIIGEFKKASPSLGTITSKIDLMERIAEYNASVDAISCLTEEDHFHGNVEYLKEIRAKSQLPILRKDFMICEYQFYEAKVIGASAILLICAILTDEQLKSYYELATSLGLSVLVEAHDEKEVRRAIAIGADIIGVNNRDLKTFTVDIMNSVRLRTLIPDSINGKPVVYVSESGIRTPEDIDRLKGNGTDAVLIGETFMRSPDKKAAFAWLRGEDVEQDLILFLQEQRTLLESIEDIL